MGKPVRFRRGIATVIPNRASGTVSQIASLKGCSNIRELRILKSNECYINPCLSEAPVGVPLHCSPCSLLFPFKRKKERLNSNR